MWQVNDVIVISDVHLSTKKGGAGKDGQELFQADEALGQFLTWVLREAADSLVVLNGDILDYLSISPGPEAKTAVTDFLHLPERTRAIVEDHPAVFDALARLAASPRHQIVFTAGNHDPELIFPSVQQVIEKRLSNSASAPPLRWFVQGDALALQVGAARTIVEHGDVLDAWNRVDRSAMRSAVSLASRGLLSHHRYQAPPGSRLVLDCLISLKQDYPWVELLKPETSTVPHLLRYYLPKERLPEFKDALFSYIQAAKNHLVVQLCEEVGPHELFMEAAGELAGAESDSALGHFRKLWNDLNRQATALRKNSLISRLRQAAVKDSFFDVAAADAGTYKVLSFLVGNGADLLIHGHTHSAKAYKVAARAADGDKDGLYLNSGTWAQLMRLPAHDGGDDVWQQFLDDLEGGEARGFANGFQRLTFARVSSGRGQTTARLGEWKDGSPVELAAYAFAPERRTWEQES
ncbi:MAG TPA: metallophosphoesterase [Pyrinomonadaceae bacterium]